VIQLFLVLAVLAVVFGVAAAVTGKAEGLSHEPQDLASVGIPRDRAMTVEDVLGLRFALAVRGYRMDEVDDALDRLAAEIASRDATIAHLHAELDAAHGPADAEDDASAGDADVAEVAQAFAPIDPAPERSVFARPAEPVAPVEQDESDEDEYVPSDATGDVPSGTPVDPIPPAPAEPAEPDPVTPEFVAPPANPFRPEVPDIPTYDPWAVTPRSRYTEGPTFVEVEHDDDADPVDAIAEHQTGYAPAPPDATVATPTAPAAPAAPAEDDDAQPTEQPTEQPPWPS
jgi:DivIVA domain-containing protein